MQRMLLQSEGVLRLHIPVLSHPEHGDLLEALELLVGKAPNSEVVKIVHQNAADVRRHAVIGNDVNEQAAVGQAGQALDQKPLLMPGPARRSR